MQDNQDNKAKSCKMAVMILGVVAIIEAINGLFTLKQTPIIVAIGAAVAAIAMRSKCKKRHGG